MALEHINSWSKRAKCQDLAFADQVFFPDTGKGSTTAINEGKKFCTDCPVISQCKIYAIAHGVHGIWGGTSKAERDRVDKNIKQAIRTMYIVAGQLEPLNYHNEEQRRLNLRSLPAELDPIVAAESLADPIQDLLPEGHLPYAG